MFGIKEIYWILINSVSSFIFLFIIAKILGKKQIAQLEFIDYAIGISLGSISAEWSINPTQPFYYYIIAMAIFFVLALLSDLIGRKTPFLKHLLKGKPVTLIYDGKIQYKELVKSKIDVNDLLTMLREKGYFNINDVAYAIFETSGELSVLPKGNQKPIVMEDIAESKIKKSSLTNILIVDGVISKSGLTEINKDKEWLFKKFNIKNKTELKNIALVTYNKDTKESCIHYKEK